ncbi:hypothetical protein F7725_021057 [Dissostichus mawsoni]|uniref:Uncharacterized protein n=1 Tax=Dissostichus mawsoni TaxID=36200 RepID=A0A7J5YGW7_DISMA|nr:hypothetical protein F7725_021057 [Dissostichus mawsoni]
MRRAVLSSPDLAHRPLYVFVFVEERQSQEAARRVHQSSERGAPAAASLECGVERNLYCPIVPLFPRAHHTPARPVHLQGPSFKRVTTVHKQTTNLISSVFTALRAGPGRLINIRDPPKEPFSKKNKGGEASPIVRDKESGQHVRQMEGVDR